MSDAKPAEIKCSRAYWTHGVLGPYTLKAEQRLDVLVSFDRRLTPAAGVVFRFLVSWDMEEHGNALASVDFISSALKAQDPAGVGLSSSAVGAALKLLRETGWIIQTHRGTGPKNASRYEPAWTALALASRGEFPSILANRPHIVEGSVPSTHSGQYRPHIVDASAENRPDIVDQDSLTDAPKEAPTVSKNVSALAPGDGLAATPGGAGGFDRCWIAYGRYGSKQASRKVFEAIENPVVDLIAARASAWAASAKPGQRRMPFEKWLVAEKYDEADRTVAPKPTNTKPTKPASGASRGLSRNIKRFKITDHQTEGSAFADFYEIFTFEGEDGTKFTQRMHVLKANTQNSDDAPDYYLSKKLGQAAFGRGNPIGEWVGRVVGVNGDADGIAFHWLPEENPPSQVEPSLLTNNSEPAAHTAVKPQPTRTARPLTEAEEAERADYDAWFEAQLEDDAA